MLKTTLLAAALSLFALSAKAQTFGEFLNKPELPIFADVVPGYDSRGWFGYIAPAGTPRDIVGKLNDEINRAMKQPDVAEKIVASGLIIVTEPPEFFGDMIQSDFAKYGKLAKDIGFQPQ